MSNGIFLGWLLFRMLCQIIFFYADYLEFMAECHIFRTDYYLEFVPSGMFFNIYTDYYLEFMLIRINFCADLGQLFKILC